MQRLLDPGTPFLELSTLAGWLQDTPDPDKSVAGGGQVVGIGMVSGTRVMLVADDAGVASASGFAGVSAVGSGGGVRPVDGEDSASTGASRIGAASR